LAIRLEQRRKRPEPRGDRQKIRGALALLPERGAHAGPTTGEQQGAGGGFTEAGRKERRGSELPHHERFDVIGIRQQQVRIGWLLTLWKAHDEPLVAPHHLGVDAGSIAYL